MSARRVESIRLVLPSDAESSPPARPSAGKPGGTGNVENVSDEILSLYARFEERTRASLLLAQTARDRGVKPGSKPLLRKVMAHCQRYTGLNANSLDPAIIRECLIELEDLNQQVLDALL